eukprot:TRINITY_DN10269_c0_g7_i1.p1 TRINITY_DN10269_c0_g7~~TRINITY_DN10269_c0_g7_i1.p1  ORF type:complete len:254 (+),score=30.76 TRINITY_DN10269_c0_g7_i1:102-863(+)
MNTCKVGKVDSLTSKTTIVTTKEAPYQNFFNITQVRQENAKRQSKRAAVPSKHVKSDVKEEDKFVTEIKTHSNQEEVKNSSKESIECNKAKSPPKIIEVNSIQVTSKKKSSAKKESRIESAKRRHAWDETQGKSKRKCTDNVSERNKSEEVAIPDAKEVSKIIEALQKNNNSIREFVTTSQQHLNQLSTLIKEPKEGKNGIPSTALYRVIGSLLVPPVIRLTFHNRTAPNDYTMAFDVSMESETLSMLDVTQE